mgnify:CR=1 FL=1|jgi:adenosylhomocysteine nucleosidase
MKWLMTYAVKEEYTEIKFPHDEIIPVCTGIGKVNAAFRLTEAIYENKPDAVLNIGTVGTVDHQVGTLFVCRKFIDRDMQKLASLGLPYEIEFQEYPVIQGFSWVGKREGVCNTGDSFLTELTDIEGDIVDMEAYAQAVVCKERQLPFVSVKYVTDVIGQNSVKHWQDKLAEARKSLNEFFKI